MDLHRYALDAAALDFILVSDHNMGSDKEYPWWRTQKANDLYTVPRAFISMYGYERSVPYPNGHRNVIWTERGHRTLPLPRAGIRKQMAEDTGKLYDYLRRTGGICTPHTSATEQGTNWAEHDDALEPVVELFQGFDSSYESPARRGRSTTRAIESTDLTSRTASSRSPWTRATVSASSRRAITSRRTSATPASWPRSSAARD